MSHIPAGLKAQVERRAAGRCEYCQISQSGQEARFHVDHIVPCKEGGATTLANLCLACVSCSLRKGAKTHAVDPDSGETIALFNPRCDAWADHFVWKDCVVQAFTATGRATIAALVLNRPLILEIRREEKILGRHPL
jgi:5-methylcytosine-specific restriction endonuclease McrA